MDNALRRMAMQNPRDMRNALAEAQEDEDARRMAEMYGRFEPYLSQLDRFGVTPEQMFPPGDMPPNDLRMQMMQRAQRYGVTDDTPVMMGTVTPGNPVAAAQGVIRDPRYLRMVGQNRAIGNYFKDFF